MTIVVVDAEPGEIPCCPEYSIRTAADLPLAEDDFRRMAMIYNVTELCTAVKPWAMEMLLNGGGEVATYLDPDIEVFRPLDDLAALADVHSIVLTPHTVKPIPRDGLQPTEADIMLAGAYNLGYISVSGKARSMLEWWKARLERDSVVAPERALFVDQRWIDLVPGYFRNTIVRDPEFNVAYWNLHERDLTKDGDTFLVDGRPLAFFHYSGYDVEQPWLLNKYYSKQPRVRMTEHPTVYELCATYGQHLRQLDTELANCCQPYRFDRLADGTPIVGGVRASYRTALIDADRKGLPRPPVPFVGGDEELIEWLRSPAREGSHIGKFLIGLWESRPDLRKAFPDPLGANERDFWNWATGATEETEPEVLACRRLWNAQPPSDPNPLVRSPGVNVSGYFAAELGVGEAGRLLIRSVQASGLPFCTALETGTLSRQNARYESAEADVRYPVTVAVVNADQFPEWAHTTGAHLVDDSYVIGLWAWELEDFPPYPASLEIVDEIWAYSEFVKTAIERKTTKPVHVLPLPVELPETAGPLDRELFGLSADPYFLLVFDHLSIFQRKNPLAVIDAFKRAFPQADGPQLVIKSINGDQQVSSIERLRVACLERPDIHVIDGYFSRPQVNSLMAECLAYVSLHRSEGFGLTVAEAMAFAKPVIATAYSGNLDFMSPETSLPVPFELVPVGAGNDPYPPSAVWAEPDVAVAAEHMKWIVDHPDQARELGIRARQSIADRRSIDAAAEFVRDRVTDISSSRLAAGGNNSEAVPAADVPTEPRYRNPLAQRAFSMIHSSPAVGSPSRFPRLAKRYRQLLYRALVHHDERNNEQMSALLDAVTEATDQMQRFQSEASEQMQRLQSEASEQMQRFHFEQVDWKQKIEAAHDSERHRLELVGRDVSKINSALGAASEHLLDVDRRVQDMTPAVVRIHDEVLPKLNQLEAELIARPYTSEPDGGTFLDDDGTRVMGYGSSSATAGTYADFADMFRGSEEFVASLLKPYIPLLIGRSPLLDIGSGRGELLEMLAAVGVQAEGVDSDESMVARCARKGLTVHLGDGLEYLERLKPGSLGAVTAIEVIEHLTPADIERFFHAAFEALEPGGLLLAETVNPHSPPALKAFWLDLTHVRPLYPESMIGLAREHRFTSARTIFPNSTGDLDSDLRLSGSYAITAYR